jgi:hypothetical protein
MAKSKGFDTYPRPRYASLLIAYANDNELSYSEAVEDMIMYFFRVKSEASVKAQNDLVATLERRIENNPTLVERRKKPTRM